MDLAIAQASLRRASRGEIGPTVRIARPRGSAAAFGRIDSRREGFATAVRRCREMGFAPVLRSVGGHASAYTDEAVVVDHVEPAGDPGRQLHQRFADFGRFFADIFGGLGIDARVGEVPGEFCPGAYSINARSAVKLVGTSQRVVRGAWLFSAVIVVDDAQRLRRLLPPVYEALGLRLDPAAVGSVADEAPGTDVAALREALETAYARARQIVPAALDDATTRLAADLVGDHLPRI